MTCRIQEIAQVTGVSHVALACARAMLHAAELASR
jgi:hypothetical protein